MAADQYSKLHIDFTDDGTLKVITDGTVSLQKQVRALRQELSVAGPEQQQQIRMALAQAELGLERTKAQSKELFGQLAMLPGPLGNFASQANMGYLALRTLSQLSFKDIVTDLKIMGQTLFGIQNSTELFYGKGAQSGNVQSSISNALAAGAGAGLGAGLAGGNKGSGAPTGGVTQSIGGFAEYNKQYQDFLELNSKVQVSADQALQYEKAITGEQMNVSSARLAQLQKEGAVYYENIVKYQKATEAYGESFTANRQLVDAAKTLSSQFKDLGVVIDNGTLKIARNDEALRALTKDELAAVNSGKQLIITEEGLVVATTAFGNALRGVGAAVAGVLTTIAELLPLLLAIAAIVKGVEWFIEVVTGAKAAEAANIKLIESLKGVQERLELNSSTEKNNSEKRLAALKAAQTDEKTLREQNIKDQKEQLKILEDAISESVTNQNKAIENLDKLPTQVDEQSGKLKTAKFFGIGQTEIDNAVKSLDDANKQVAGLYIKRGEKIAEINKLQSDNTVTITKNAYADNLRNLDAKIQLQINKENTSSETLLKLYKQRNDMVDAENKKRNNYIGNDERRLRDFQQEKTANDAVIDYKVRSLNKEKVIINKSLEDQGKDTEKYFDLREQLAKKQSEIEIAQAGKDAHTKSAVITEAETKLSKELDAIYVARLTAQLKVLNETGQGLTEYTQEYYQNLLNIIDKNEKIELANYEGNEKMKLVITEKYNKQRLDLESKQMMDNANLLKRLGESETEGNLTTPKNVNKSIDAKFKLLQQSLDSEYQAEIRNKKKTNTELAAIDNEYNKKTKLLNQQKLAEKQVYEQKYVDLAKYTGDFIMALGEAEMAASQGKDKSKFDSAKKYAVAGIWLEKAAALGSIYMNTQKAMSQDMGKFGIFGIPLTAIDLAIGVAQAAGVIIAGATAASSINGTDFSPASTSNMGKNYASGGMINGADHSQGGVNINAQGGEAVMTRGAVTMFQPLLSMMNQMGGGTAFSGAVAGQAKWDNPKSPGSPTEPQIIKTYVVQSELTSAQQRQARLKSLSTL